MIFFFILGGGVFGVLLDVTVGVFGVVPAGGLAVNVAATCRLACSFSLSISIDDNFGYFGQGHGTI